MLRLFPSPCLAWVNLPKYKTPTSIALGLIKTSKLPHHNYVVTPFEEENVENLVTVVVFYFQSTRFQPTYMYVALGLIKTSKLPHHN